MAEVFVQHLENSFGVMQRQKKNKNKRINFPLPHFVHFH